MARPRSARAHEQVLASALELFADRGFDSTSMDSIAEASGVSKATIYKHWPDKFSLCLEIMSRVNGIEEEIPVSETGDIREDLIAVLSFRLQDQPSEMQSRLMPHFMAYAAKNPEFAREWRIRWMDPPRKKLSRILQRGVDEGLLSPDLDYDISVALLLGPLLYRHFLMMAKQKIPEQMPVRIVDSFLKAHATKDLGKLRNKRK